MRLRYAALSDVGKVRRDNQDSGYAGPHLLVIADGVGGSARGDIASSATVEELRRLDAPPGDDMLGALAGAIHRTHDRIAGLVAENPDIEGTSSTVTAAIFDGTSFGVGHVGDSRGYLLRDGAISQITADHTFVQSLIDEGRITEDEARVHPHRNLILRAVDGVHEPEPDVFMLEVSLGDRVLLCSDGCSGVLADDELARILGEGTPDHAAVSLISASLDAGSSDNITVVVADLVEDDAVDDPETSASAVTGPLLVGAAAEAPRRLGLGGGANRSGDTGELDAVPESDDHGDREDVDPEEMRYAPQAPRRFTWARRIAFLAVLAILIGIVAVAGYKWTQSQFYVAEDGGEVAIFRGVAGRRPRHRDAPGRGRQQPDPGGPADVQRPPGARRDQREQPRGRARHRPPAATARAVPRPRRPEPVPVTEEQPYPEPEGEEQQVGQAQPEQVTLRESVSGPRRVHRVAMSSLSPNSGSDIPHGLRGFVHRRRRGAELVLLVMSLVVGIGAYAAVDLGVNGTLPVNLFTYGAWLAALVIGCHIVIRIFAEYADPILLPIVSALNGLGLAIIHRIDLANEAKDAGARTFAGTQLIWMTIGVALFVAVIIGLRDHRRLQAFTYTAGLAAIVLLLLPLVPGLGTNINGARIWIRLGPMSFQPGELAKLLLVIAFSGYLVLHRDALALAGRRFLFVDLPRGRDLGPILGMWLVSLGILVFQNDLGSSLLFFGLFLVMLYVATERPGWLVVGGTLFVVGAYFGYLALGHVQLRVQAWLDPFDPDARAFQIVQGLYGLAWGGLVGRGLGQGNPEITPYSYSDFILPSIGEELGLTGVMAVILLYGILVERGLRTALICRDNFGKLMASGLAIVFAVQVFVVLGGVTKLIPLTGLTTPFLSYGGSSLVANWAIIALLLRISDQARRPPPELVEPDEGYDADATQVVRIRR